MESLIKLGAGLTRWRLVVQTSEGCGIIGAGTDSGCHVNSEGGGDYGRDLASTSGLVLIAVAGQESDNEGVMQYVSTFRQGSTVPGYRWMEKSSRSWTPLACRPADKINFVQTNHNQGTGRAPASFQLRPDRRFPSTSKADCASTGMFP